MHIAVNRLSEQPPILHLGCWEQEASYATLNDRGELKLERLQ